LLVTGTFLLEDAEQITLLGVLTLAGHIFLLTGRSGHGRGWSRRACATTQPINEWQAPLVACTAIVAARGRLGMV